MNTKQELISDIKLRQQQFERVANLHKHLMARLESYMINVSHYDNFDFPFWGSIHILNELIKLIYDKEIIYTATAAYETKVSEKCK